MRRLVSAGTASAIALAMLLSGCGSSSSSATSAGGAAAATSAKSTSLEVMLDWVPNPDHIALYTALAKDDFTAQNLKVKLEAPSDVTDVAKLVATGTVPLGISYEPDTIIAGATGLPITAVGALVPNALNSIIAPKKSGITSLASLRGKTVGVSGLESDDAFLKAIEEKAGIPVGSIKKVNVGASLLPAVVSGRVDAILGGYRNVEAVQVRDDHLDPTVIPVTQAGVPQYDELVIIANSKRLKTDAGYRTEVREFLAGLAKGAATAEADPSAGIAAMGPVIKGYPASQVAQMVETTAPLLRNPLGFGQMSITAWQGFANWMLANKLISKHVDASTVATDAYLPAK